MIATVRKAFKKFLAHHMLIIEYCHDCGREQPLVWHAPESLWREFSGTHDGNGVLCPECFDRRASATGALLMWTCAVECRGDDRHARTGSSE